MSTGWLVYGRQSLGNERSIDEQVSSGQRRAVQEGGTLVGTESDTVSASRFGGRTRDGWDRTLARLTGPAVAVLWLWESSRGDRSLASWAGLLDVCRRHDVRIYVETHGRLYDPGVPRDWRTLAEDGVDSAYESEKTSLRVRREKTRLLEAGLPDGPCPYGYERAYDPATRRLLEQRAHPVHAETVREIYRRVSTGDPISAIVDDLNGRGVPSPAGVRWARSVVRKIASSPLYIAERHRDGQVYPQSWPPLVDRDLWHATQRVLSDPVRLTTRPGRARWLSSYIAACDECGEGLTAAKRRAESVPNYVCPGGHVGIRQDWLDDYLTDLVVERLSRPDVYERLTRSDDAEVVQARAVVVELRTRLDETYGQVAAGALSPAGASAVEARVIPLIDAAERRAKLALVPPQLRALVQPGRDVRELWELSPVAARRDVLRALVASVRVRRAGPGRPRSLDPDRVLVVWADQGDVGVTV